MKKLILVLFVLFQLQSFSQNTDAGYVITNNNDTIRGTFKNDILSKKIKIIINGELKKFDVTELLGYVKGDEINKRFSNNLYMATLEKSGRINIWAIRVEGEGHDFNQFFLEKDGVSCELTRKTWKTTIADWLKDYDCNAELMKNLSIKKFEKIIEEYNSCKTH
jgi:hypothetical protein